MRRILLAACLLPVAACASSPSPDGPAPVRVLVAGAVDLSGAASAVAAVDPEGLLRDVRFVVRGADLALAGPLLAAPAPGAADLLAGAGFDAVLTADEVPYVARLGPAEASLAPAGGAYQVGDLRVVVLYADAGKAGAGAWSRLTLADFAADATIVLLDGPPAAAAAAGRDMTRLGADVVVLLAGADAPVEVVESPGGRRCVLASGLGPLLSGGDDPAGRRGTLLEVLVDGAGVAAYRLGRSTSGDRRAHFTGWDLPAGDAALLDGEWWELARPVQPAGREVPTDASAFGGGDLTTAAIGDVTGDGVEDIVAAYHHPFRPNAVGETRPGAVPVDSLGRSAHLGVFDLAWEPLWAAGRIPHPVGALAACDGAVALAYTGLDDPQVVATGAAVWEGLGLRSIAELPGPGTPGCADVDGDGALDPVQLDRAG